MGGHRKDFMLLEREKQSRKLVQANRILCQVQTLKNIVVSEQVRNEIRCLFSVVNIKIELYEQNF